MERKFKLFAMLLALALAMPLTAFGQAGTGGITGTVLDASRSAVPDAKISVINTATGAVERETSTTSAGVFNVSLLPPGTYRLVVVAKGFERFEASNIIVRVTETTTVPVTLKVGAVTETVEVSAAAAPVNLTNPTTGTTIGSETAGMLPLSTRNFFALLTLSAGANTEIFDSAALGRGAVTINVNGQRPTNNNYQLEGVNANDVNLPVLDNVPLPNPQSIQEFKTQTSLYDASNGRNGGGNIQVTLKSGTDKYHGDAYEFFRNNILNANDYFLNAAGEPRPVLRQNQFGGSIGGPVIPGSSQPNWLKNFYFFFNYQGTRAASGIAVGTAFAADVPVLPTTRTSASLIPVFFPNGTCPAPVGAANTTGTNCLPASITTLDPTALAFLNLPSSKCAIFNDGTHCIPTVPGTAGVDKTGAANTGTITFSSPGFFHDNQFTGTIDKQITKKDKISFRSFNATFDSNQPFGEASTLAFNETFPNTNRFYKVGWTRVISNNVVNEALVGFNRFTFARTPTEPISLADVGAIRGNSGEFPAAFRINIPSVGATGFSLGTGVNDDRGGVFNTMYYSDNLSWTVGKHLLRFGGDVSRYQLNRFNNFAVRGDVNFASTPAGLGAGGAADPTFPAFSGWQNFLLGRVTSTQGSSGFSTFHFRALDVGSYVQDDWKMTRRLTVNLGLRWEGLSTANEKNNFLSSFSGLNDGTTGPIQIIHPADTPKVGTPGVSRCTLSSDCFNIDNWGPRLGFAWDMFGNQKTVVRGGYGYYYQRISNQALLQTAGGLPFAQAVSATPLSVSFQNPLVGILPNSDFPLPIDNTIPQLVAFRTSTGADPRGILATSAAAAGRPIFNTPNGNPVSGFFFFPQRNLRPPEAQQWNLTVQRELFKGWVLEVGYVGTRGTHLIGTGRPFDPSQICGDAVGSDPTPCLIPAFIGKNVMVAPGTPDVTQQADGSILLTNNTNNNKNARVPYQFLGLANSRGFFQGEEGNSVYHGLQSTLSHQFASGLYLQAAYTWSRSIDNSSGSVFGDELNGLTQFGDLLHQADNRGLSDFNRTHRFSLSYNYDIPFGKWFGIANSGVKGRLVNGWAVNGVTTLQTSTPITVFDSSAVLLEDMDFVNTTNFALVNPGANAYSTGSVHSRLGGWFNPASFTVGGQCVNSQNQPVAASDPTCTGFAAVGNTYRNTFKGPFQQNWDMSFVKITKITEQVNIEFRSEFFNIFNHPAFNNPGVSSLGGTTGNLGVIDISSGNSAIVSTVNRPRIIQFALKLNF